MKRITLEPRENWQTRLEEAGCFYHTIEGKAYWQEEAAYVFSAAEIDHIEEAANTIHDMCIALAGDVVAKGDYQGYGVSDEVKALIERSWNAREPSLFGRFDLGYNGQDIKLFEYNADTPTALPEASVWQYHALQDRSWPDQFNSIHENLVGRWPAVWERTANVPPQRVHFAASAEGRHEDFGNLHYMQEVATEAGVTGTSSIDIEQLGWRAGRDHFLDVQDRDIEVCFKLFPWEWLLQSEFGWHIAKARTAWVEPAWKLLLSTKAILPLLWQRHPDHPLLLESYFEAGALKRDDGKMWVRKPLLGREGANITIRNGLGAGPPTPPLLEHYDKDGYVLQEYFRVPPCGPHTPILGVWVVGSVACGLGIREEEGAITTNESMFVPHYFEE